MCNKKIKLLILTNIMLLGGVLSLNAEASPNYLTHPSVDLEIQTPKEAYEEFTQITLAEQQKREEEKRIEAERVRLEEEAKRKTPHFNPYNVSEVSNLTREQIYQMLEGTALQTLSNAYYYYEQTYQVNAVFMIALTAEESGWGRSELAMFRNNLSGHKDPYTSDWTYYSDWGECLEESFRLIREEYLNEDGRFYTGSNIFNMNLTYCPDSEAPSSWANNIISITKILFNKLEE